MQIRKNNYNDEITVKKAKKKTKKERREKRDSSDQHQLKGTNKICMTIMA